MLSATQRAHRAVRHWTSLGTHAGFQDQSYFTGPGNIYRAEILFKAGVHPDVAGAVDPMCAAPCRAACRASCPRRIARSPSRLISPLGLASQRACPAALALGSIGSQPAWPPAVVGACARLGTQRRMGDVAASHLALQGARSPVRSTTASGRIPSRCSGEGAPPHAQALASPRVDVRHSRRGRGPVAAQTWASLGADVGDRVRDVGGRSR